MVHFTAVLFAVLLTASTADFGLTAAVSSSVSVDVPDVGRINGLQYSMAEGARVDVFVGIPFAEPPIGSLRFQPPVQRKRSNGTIDATRLPNACFQLVDDSYDSKYVDMWNPNTNISEDCLYLNVWRPSTRETSKKAVMVWIYGGSFTSGSSALDVYEGKVLSSKGDVVVVSMQYRVGPLGFLALGSASNGGVPGNAGLLDQQLALQWVRDHIAAFGGDPERVTLFGESAGSCSISYHLISKGSENLFRSAIMMSATFNAHWAYYDRKTSENKAREFAQRVGCDASASIPARNVVECLQRVDAYKLTTAQFDAKQDGPYVTDFKPTLDHNFIDSPPEEILRERLFQKKNIIVGNVHNEGSYFLLYWYSSLFPVDTPKVVLSEDDYKFVIQNSGVLKSSKKLVVDAVAFEYARPCEATADSSNWTPNYALSLDRFLGDTFFVCPVVNFSRIFAAESEKSAVHSVYVYTFNHRTSGNPWPAWFGAAHGYEIDHIFGVPFRENSRALYSDDERTLSGYAITYWTNFAKTGDPNQGSGSSAPQPPQWPKYTIDDRRVLVLDTGTKLTTQSGLRERECDYWFTVVEQLEAAAGQLQTTGMLWITLVGILVRYMSLKY